MRIGVVGAGVVGASATTALLRAGHDVTCYEEKSIMGARSVGSTRIFRLSHSDPDLVRLAQEARRGFELWSIEAERPMVVDCECVITGTDITARAQAMAAAGAAYEMVGAGSGRLRLPVREEPAAALIDVAGGVVDVDAVREYLTKRASSAVISESVYRLDITTGGAARVRSAGGCREYDVLLVAAGAETHNLAAQVGVYTPPLVAHHLRCTFRADGDTTWQAWIDKPADRPSTYQHQSGPGLWAVGGNVDPALVRWEVGRDAAVEASRSALLEYASAHLAVDPTIVESLYCTSVPDLGDGVNIRRNGPVVVVYGDNLMKFAPVLGENLARLLLGDE